jgi:hypothetical protein
MEEKHPLNRTKEVSVDVVSSVDANTSLLWRKLDFHDSYRHYVWRSGRKSGLLISRPFRRTSFSLLQPSTMCGGSEEKLEHLERERYVRREREGKIQKRNNEFNKMKNFICMRKEEEKTNETKKRRRQQKKLRKHLGKISRRKKVF